MDDLALKILALLLIAGVLLYFWRTAQARFKVQAAEEVAWFGGRVRELQRRKDALHVRLRSALALLNHYLAQRRSLAHQIEKLSHAYETREKSFAALVEMTVQHRMLGLADARHQLPYLLSLIQHESNTLEAERRFVADEEAELQRLLEAKPSLKAALEGEAIGKDLRLKGLAELQEAVQRELEAMPRVEEHWSRLQQRSLELELQLAREQREGLSIFAAQLERELAPHRLQEFLETMTRLRRLAEELEREIVPRLMERLEGEIMPHLTEGLERVLEREIVPRLTERLESRVVPRLVENWKEFERRWLEKLEGERKQMEARVQKGQPSVFATQPTEELAPQKLQEFLETMDRLRRLMEGLERLNVPRLRERLEYEVMPLLTEGLERGLEREIVPRLTERLESEILPRLVEDWKEIGGRWLEKLEDERKQIEERLAALEAPRPSQHPVLLQSLWQRRIRPAEWQTLLVYLITGPAGLSEAEADARRRLHAPLEMYSTSSAAARRPIPQGTLVTVIPELPSFRFNPPFATLLWLENWHCAEIRMQALPGAKPGKTVKGRVAFFVGPLLIGENDLEVVVVDGAEGAIDPHPQERVSRTPLLGRSLAAAYRSIFVSYSHADSEIVDRLQAAYRALGDSYFRDIEILRSGETWSPALLAKIREADIFQLCWSEAARASRFVEQEWRHALDLERDCFVRPMYWREPLPNPPAELANLHFTYVEMDSSTDP